MFINHRKENSFWTIPNVLSLYRKLIFPVILYLIVIKNEFSFSIFITISLITDILDGWIARVFKMQTDIGAKLDSWADLGTYILAFFAIYVFKWNYIKTHLVMLIIFFSVWLISYLYVFVKFKGIIGLHTYMFKLTGYFQGGFIVSLFVFGFNYRFFYFSLIWGTLACIEEIIIITLLKTPKTNVKGLYWIIKNLNKNL